MLKQSFYLLFLLIGFVLSCEEKGKVVIIKQWHLAPSTKTLDVEKSKRLAQFENQKAIYKLLDERIHKGQNVIIAEGCEKGQIDENFLAVFNGWSMELLQKASGRDDFSDVMAPAPMKIKAKRGKKVKVLCGDDLELIDRNNLAMSDLRGYAGFYERLKAAKGDRSKYNSYKRALEKLAGKSIGDPVEYARIEAMKALKLSKRLIERRNHAFLKVTKELMKENPGAAPAIVIGGIHAKHLGKLFSKEGIPFEIRTPIGYSEKDHSLFKIIEESLSPDVGSEKGPEVVWLQAPEGFDPKKIPFKNFLVPEDVATNEEWRRLKELMDSAGLSEKILLSDYDKDGIRDFTVSTNGALLVISAEDDDWDGDGEPNLSDSRWEGMKLESRLIDSSSGVTNIFNLKNLNASKLLKELKEKGIRLLGRKGKAFDLLFIKAIHDTASKAKLEKGKLRYFRLARPKIKYGREVYFSYNPSTLTVDVYGEELMAHFELIHKKYYKESSEEDFLRGYFLPLLYHSVAHELVHAMDPPYRSLSQDDGWSFVERPYRGKYLSHARLERKVMRDTLGELAFKGKPPESWIKEGKNTDGFTKGFLVDRKFPSHYALAKPSEWIAEKGAMCFLRIVYPDSSKREVSQQYEALLGINPSAPGEEFCKAFYTP